MFVWLHFCSYDLVKHLDLSKSSHTTLYYLFNTMLMMLLVFHIYWWVMIYSIIRRQLSNSGKVGEDIRSGKLYIAYKFKFYKPAADYDFLLSKYISIDGKYMCFTSLNG